MWKCNSLPITGGFDHCKSPENEGHEAFSSSRCILELIWPKLLQLYSKCSGNKDVIYLGIEVGVVILKNWEPGAHPIKI